MRGVLDGFEGLSYKQVHQVQLLGLVNNAGWAGWGCTTLTKWPSWVRFPGPATTWSDRLMVRTSGFQPGNRGSIPRRTIMRL